MKFTAELLMLVMGPEVFPNPPELERAHQTPTFRPPGPLRTFLVCVSTFQQKEAALRWAGELEYQGTISRFFQDLSAALAKKRAAFNDIKQALCKKTVRFHQLYPAQLCLMYGDDAHTFHSPDEAPKFYDQKIQKKDRPLGWTWLVYCGLWYHWVYGQE